MPNLGCNESDWTSFPSGTIALVIRGVCPFQTKVDLALAASASGLIIYNDGASGDRTAPFGGSIQSPSIPVFSGSFALGLQLSYLPSPVTMSMTIDNLGYNATTYNVIADTKTGRTDRTVVVGELPGDVGGREEEQGGGSRHGMAREEDGARWRVPRRALKRVKYARSALRQT